VVELELLQAAGVPEAIIERVVGGVRPGSIILLHVWYKGYRFVTIGELLARLEEG
jgi:hypothetical protein